MNPVAQQRPRTFTSIDDEQDDARSNFALTT